MTSISQLYTGSISDREIDVRSGFLDLPFQENDSIMADKVFTIQDLLPFGVSLNTEISVSPGDRRKSPSSRPWRAGYSDPNKKIFILEDGKIHCVNFSLQAR